MHGHDSDIVSVTLRVNRFAPRVQREGKRPRKSSPFGRKSSPFGESRSARRPQGKQWVQEYQLQVSPNTTILDCLLSIKRNTDPTLAFRYSCGHGICGSDAVAINGTPTLLCKAHISDWLQPMPSAQDDGFRKTGEAREIESTATDDVREGYIEIAPLPGFPVQRDLIVDIDSMLEQIRSLRPYLIHNNVVPTTPEGKLDVFEFLQSPEQLAKFELLSNCITCGVCEGSCPVYAGGEAFIGPAALINQARFVRDSRDEATQSRLDAIDRADGIQACQSVRACSRECPVGIDVGEEIWQLIAQVKER